MVWLIRMAGGKMMAYGLIAAVAVLLAGGYTWRFYNKGVQKERHKWTVTRDNRQNTLDRSVNGVNSKNGGIDGNLRNDLEQNNQKYRGE